ncbi:hypothetical protein RhiirA4_474370, partial [Rhizophagus irregularis]
MPFYNLSKAELKSHQRKHRRGKTINQKEVYCIQCYPTDSIPADNIPDGFEKFWLWISIQYIAKQYTGATVAAFKVLKTEFFITTQLNTLVELSFYLHKLFELTNGFKSLPTDTQVTNAYQIFHNTPINNNANMNEGQMRDFMKLIWGADATTPANPRNVGDLLENTLNNNTTAITNALQNNLNALNALTTANQNRTTSKGIILPHHPRLYVYANGWPDNRKIALAAGFLKEAARDWYEEDRGNINQWHVNNNANNFDTRLINYFATTARRNQWTRELQNIKQGENESVENYSRLGQVVIGDTDNLEATITRAKLVELGVNTTLLTTTPITANTAEPISATTTTVKPTPQIDKMKALTKQMQQLALNYANLSS